VARGSRNSFPTPDAGGGQSRLVWAADSFSPPTVSSFPQMRQSLVHATETPPALEAVHRSRCFEDLWIHPRQGLAA